MLGPNLAGHEPQGPAADGLARLTSVATEPVRGRGASRYGGLFAPFDPKGPLNEGAAVGCNHVRPRGREPKPIRGRDGTAPTKDGARFT